MKKRREKANGKTLHGTIWEEHTLFIYLLIERKKSGNLYPLNFKV